jgi:oligosaccharyltransferase complex subunit beta
LLEFIDDGRSVLLVGGSGKVAQEIATHSALAFDAAHVVFDHAHFAAGDDAHTTVLVDDKFAPINGKVVFGDAGRAAPLLYKGVAVKSDSALVSTLVRAHSSAFTAKADGSPVSGDVLAGFDVSLVAALHARNGARVTAVGSLDLFSDSFTDRSPAGGAAARASLARLTAWTFGRHGVLRARDAQHKPVGAIVGGHGQYRVGQQIEFSVVIEQWNGDKKLWQPFITDDVQLEFTMLDPHVRQFLKANAAGTYSLEFKLPDVYGVFTFRIAHQRPGYTPLLVETRTPVRPLRHDEYERFIVSAFPYYASAFAMMGGLFLFSFAFLYHGDK